MMQGRLLMCKVKAKIHFAGLTELYSIGLRLILVAPIFGIFLKEFSVFLPGSRSQHVFKSELLSANICTSIDSMSFLTDDVALTRPEIKIVFILVEVQPDLFTRWEIFTIRLCNREYRLHCPISKARRGPMRGQSSLT